MSKKTKKIVCIGGGTGTFTVLSGLKKYPISLSVIVSMFDSGGSNKVIRDEFGLLPTSDLRQCFVALAEDGNGLEHTLRELFMYRFYKGDGINGMTFGNLFMAALSDILGSQRMAIKKTGQILKIKGKVIPVSLNDSNLVAVYENGKTLIGESLIDEPKHNGKMKIKKVYLKPSAKACPEAIKEIMDADLIVIGPGDLYTSLIPNLLVGGIKKALNKTKAKVVYILNLMTRYGQTYRFKASDHIYALEKYLGKNNIDFVLINSKPIPSSLIKKYEKQKESSVLDDLKDDYFKIIRKDLLNQGEAKMIPGDILKRSLIRHDSRKLAKMLINLCKL
ncbi:MAG: gluconeogenesis factor YvcK family protein [bacterium]